MSKRMRLLVLALVSASAAATVAAQETRSYLEHFAAAKSRLLVRESFPGTVIPADSGMFNLKPAIHLEPVIYSTPGPPAEKLYGFQVERLLSDPRDPMMRRLPARVTYLDYDEAIRLSSALAEIQRLAARPAEEGRRVTAASFEARGGMILRFEPDPERPVLVVHIFPPGGREEDRLPMAQVKVLKEALDRGIARLKEAGAAG